MRAYLVLCGAKGILHNPQPITNIKTPSNPVITCCGAKITHSD